MTLFETVATLLVLSALFGYGNHRYLGLPHTIGLVAMGLAASLAITGVEWLWPALQIDQAVRPNLAAIDFPKVLLEGFLSALLFAGAVHVNLAQVAQMKWAVALLSTVGVVISTAVVGAGMWLAAKALGIDLPFIWALAYGALISPTDPVAVLAIMKEIRVPAPLFAKIAGESLLNDGVGVVVFTIVLALATSVPGVASRPVDSLEVIRLFVVEALGGAGFGLITGIAAFWLLRGLNEHNIEIMITLALAAFTYAVALRLHLSGPIAVVVAGVIIGNHGSRFAMSPETRIRVFQFWDLVDELLNSVLFLLIGLQVLVIGMSFEHFRLAVAAIGIVLLARLVSVAIPIGVLSLFTRFSDGVIPILTWGGLRGGISIALALTLPDTAYKGTLLTASYVVVIFSILVQGLTMQRLVQRYYPTEISAPPI